MESIAAIDLYQKDKDEGVAKPWVKPVKILLTKTLLQVLELKIGLSGLVPWGEFPNLHQKQKQKQNDFYCNF